MSFFPDPKGLLKLIRFELPLSAGICVALGQIFATGEFLNIFFVASASLSVFFISASILVMNDYFDVETDRINSPHRPIPSNLVTLNQALIFSIILLTAGLYLSYRINTTTFAIAIVLVLVGFSYNRFFKKTGLLGNLLVSFSVGMTFIYGGASVGLPFNKTVIFFALIAALVDLGEEIAADAMDIKGDKLIESKSLAIKFGKDIAVRISAFIFLIVVLLSFVPFIAGWFEFIYLIPIGVMDFSIGYSTIKLVQAKNEEGRKYIRFLYLGATLGLVLFIVMKLVVE